MLHPNKNLIQVSKNTADSKAWYYYHLDVMDRRMKVRQRNWCILGTLKSQKTKTEILLSWVTSKNCVMVSESLRLHPVYQDRRYCHVTTLHLTITITLNLNLDPSRWTGLLDISCLSIFDLKCSKYHSSRDWPVTTQVTITILKFIACNITCW